MNLYLKLTLLNVKKSAKDYVLYLLTTMLASSMFFSFLSLTSPSSPFRNRGADLLTYEFFDGAMQIAVPLISLVLILLFALINKHIFTRHSKDMALYTFLGMKPLGVFFLLFVELLLLNIIGIVLGIILGHILAMLLSAFIIFITIDYLDFRLIIYLDTILFTAIFFFSIFVIIGLKHTLKLSQIVLVDLWSENQKSEIIKYKAKLAGISFLIIPLLFLYVNFLSVQLYEMSEGFATDALDNGSIIVQIVILLIFISFMAFYAFSFVLYVMKTNSRIIAYKYNNIIILNNIFSKISTSIRSFGGITISLTVAAVFALISPIFAEIVEGYLNYRTKFEIMVRDHPRNSRMIEGVSDIPYINLNFAEDILVRHDVEISQSLLLRSYFLQDNDFFERGSTYAISLTDYNILRNMTGNQPVHLEYNEFTIHIDYEIAHKMLRGEPVFISAQYLNPKDKIQLQNGITLIASQTVWRSEPMTMYIFGSMDVKVVPDEAIKGLSLARSAYFANTVRPLTVQQSELIFMEIHEYFWQLYGHYYLEPIYIANANEFFLDAFFQLRSATISRDQALQFILVQRMLGIYLPIIFVMVALSIISLGQLMDIQERKNQYTMLYHLGLDKKNIHSIVNIQISCFFIVPIIMSIVLTKIIYNGFISIYGSRIITYLGSTSHLYNVFVTISIFGLLIILYFVSTLFAYKNTIKDIFE